jgi:hypothetical protein
MSASESAPVLDASLRTLAADGWNPHLGRSVLKAWRHLNADGKTSVCLAIGDRFVREVLALEPEFGCLIAADCLASADLHEAMVGTDPLCNADFVQLGIGWSLGAGDRRPSRRRALSRVAALAHQHPERLPASVGAVLDRELVAWGSRYDEHRDGGVLRALLAATRCSGPRLNAWLLRGPMEEHLPLRAAAAKAELSEVAGLALVWLAWPALVPAARRVIERVVTTDDPELLAAMVEPWAVLRARRRAERVRGVFSDRQFEQIARRRDLDSPTRRGLAAIAEQLGPNAVAALVRGGLVADRDPMVRFGLVRALVAAGDGQEADLALQDLGFDADPAVSASAIGAIAQVRSRHRRMASVDALAALSRCQHGTGRARADRALEHFEPLPELPENERRWYCPVTAVWMQRRSPDTLRDRLSIELRRPDRVSGAIGLIDRLGLAADYARELAGIAVHASDGRMRAKATLLLGKAGGSSDSSTDLAFRTLAELLGDADDRVRASAVEAISRLRGETIRLDRFTADPVARVRANAIRHACREVEAKPGDGVSDFGVMHLDAMLRDERAGHRISALWVASMVRPIELAGSVAQIAREDEDGSVRSRARRCAMKLLSAMQPKQREVGVA